MGRLLHCTANGNEIRVIADKNESSEKCLTTKNVLHPKGG